MDQHRQKMEEYLRAKGKNYVDESPVFPVELPPPREDMKAEDIKEIQVEFKKLISCGCDWKGAVITTLFACLSVRRDHDPDAVPSEAKYPYLFTR